MSADVTIIMASKWDSREPACATAYVCQYLRSLGYRVQYLDFNIRLFDLCRRLGFGELWTDSLYQQAWIQGDLRFLSVFHDIEQIEGDVVGLSFTATNRELSLWLARCIRNRWPNKKIIFGGYALYFEQELEGIPIDLADAVCKGEGEHTLRDVMARGFKNLEEVPGLYLPHADGWRLTKERPLIADLDEIPWPTFEEVDLSLYEIPDLPLMGSRGCIGRCIFCNDRFRSPKFRTRSAQSQVDELQYLKERYNTDFFIYNEPLMNGNIPLLEHKTDEILRRGLEVRYGGNLMVRPQMSPGLFQKMRRSGFTVAIVGIESGCTETLRQMRKYHDAEAGAAFIRNCHDAGIRVELNIIVGFPTETEGHFQETLRFIRDNRSHIDCIVSVATFNVVYSELWGLRDQFGIVSRPGADTFEWQTKDGTNTYEIRVDRLNRFTAEMREMGLIPARTDTEIRRQAPNPGKAFLNAYAAHWRGDATLSADDRRAAEHREQQLRRELRRISAIKTCRKLGVLDHALWLKKTLRGK